MIGKGEIRVIKMRHNITPRGHKVLRARTFGLPNSNANPGEDASPESQAPKDGHAAVAAPPERG